MLSMWIHHPAFSPGRGKPQIRFDQRGGQHIHVWCLIESISIDNADLGTLPKHLFFTMLQNLDFLGLANINPYIFQHFKLNYFVTYVNEQQVRSEDLCLIMAHAKTTTLDWFLVVLGYVMWTWYPDHAWPLHERFVHVGLWLAHGWECLEQPHQYAWHQKISAYNLNLTKRFQRSRRFYCTWNLMLLYLCCYFLSSERLSLMYGDR
jgi:hypothetical protein